MQKKEDLPAMPFYWGDWFKASDVQALPRNIRLTWIEMLGRMWESEKRGYLCINKEPFSIEELSQLLGFGGDIKECEKHVNILEKKRIFSRTKSGIIYNRRMVRDKKLSDKRAKAGKKGMNIRYNKDKICYSKNANKTLTNTENESENENEINNYTSKGECEGGSLNYFPQFLPAKFIDNPDVVEAWGKWVCYKSERGNPVTPTAAKEQLKFLVEQKDPVGVIGQSIKNQWSGLFELKEDGKNGATRELYKSELYKEGRTSNTAEYTTIDPNG